MVHRPSRCHERQFGPVHNGSGRGDRPTDVDGARPVQRSSPAPPAGTAASRRRLTRAGLGARRLGPHRGSPDPQRALAPAAARRLPDRRRAFLRVTGLGPASWGTQLASAVQQRHTCSSCRTNLRPRSSSWFPTDRSCGRAASGSSSVNASAAGTGARSARRHAHRRGHRARPVRRHVAGRAGQGGRRWRRSVAGRHRPVCSRRFGAADAILDGRCSPRCSARSPLARSRRWRSPTSDMDRDDVAGLEGLFTLRQV